MERRKFIVGAAMAASVPLAVACSRTDSGNATQFQSLPATDKRVADFMKYYTEFWTDPAKAVATYTSPQVVYTSTSGQDFNHGNGPTNNSLEDDAIFTVAYDQNGKIVHYTQFADYGGISDTVGANNMSQLHGLS